MLNVFFWFVHDMANSNANSMQLNAGQGYIMIALVTMIAIVTTIFAGFGSDILSPLAVTTGTQPA